MFPSVPSLPDSLLWTPFFFCLSPHRTPISAIYILRTSLCTIRSSLILLIPYFLGTSILTSFTQSTCDFLFAFNLRILFAIISVVASFLCVHKIRFGFLITHDIFLNFSCYWWFGHGWYENSFLVEFRGPINFLGNFLFYWQQSLPRNHVRCAHRRWFDFRSVVSEMFLALKVLICIPVLLNKILPFTIYFQFCQNDSIFCSTCFRFYCNKNSQV